MADNSQDKTEQPTPKKLQDARKKGQVAKSKDLSSALVLMAVVGAFYLSARSAIDSLERYLLWYFSNSLSIEVPDKHLPWMLLESFYDIAIIFLPIFVVAILLAFVGNVMQTGFLLAPEVIKPKLEKLNPIEGFKKIFSLTSLFELTKTILKVIVVGVVSYLVAIKYVPQMLMIFYKNPIQEMLEILDIMIVVGAAGGGAYLLLAVADFYYQKFDFNKRMRMSKQEVKDEHKQSEGDPQIKGWLRRRQREIAMNRIREEVPRATVVVTNPIHYAVALKYEEGVNTAPLLVAKGAGDIALRLKEIAAINGVPIFENPPLARTLFQQVDIGREIPAELYQSVAEVLAMVLRLKRNAI
ncbi:MAG: flagellar biosynthesis protein FlhB [Peptococcaceae bacterium BICA1-7]|nr:MAG: flagellar biosynthesis protein FlhB [Peptococcaceae bacterium BICA1-7]HBV96616.1 EscU/YscU/HrcU family type III secretion system export apparatus switch protein [Desulfotomaculum sp.]